MPSVAFGFIGIAAEIYPSKFLAFFLKNRTQMDFNDPSLWWIPRFIGAGFLLFALIIAGMAPK